MDRFIFRGITLKNGEQTFFINTKKLEGQWVTGSLITQYNSHRELEYFIASFLDDGKKTPIIPETVSLYSGQKDIYDTPLFSNDIVQYVLADDFLVTGIIRFDTYNYDPFLTINGFFLDTLNAKKISDRDYPINYVEDPTSFSLSDKKLVKVGNKFENYDQFLRKKN